MSISEASPRESRTFSKRLAQLIANPPRLASAEEEAEREARACEDALFKRVQQAGIPKRFQGAELSTCCAPARAFSERVCAGEYANLVLGGESGSGKTHTACAVLIDLMRRTGRRGLFTTLDDLLRDVRDTYGNLRRESEVVQRYARVPLLVIDEMGKAKATDWSLPIIEAVVNERYAELRPTVVTTQYRRERLAAQMAAVDGDAERAKAVVRRLLDNATVAGAVNPNG